VARRGGVEVRRGNLRELRPPPEYRDPNGNKPVHDEDLERDVISTIVFRADAIEAVLGLLKPEHFHVPACRAIFDVALELVKIGLPLADWSLRRRLEERGELGLVGGADGLSQLILGRASVPYLDRAAMRLRDLWRQRETCSRMWALVCEGHAPVGDVQAWIERSEAQIAEMTVTTGDAAVSDISSSVDAVVARLSDPTVVDSSCPTFIDAVDGFTGGMFGGGIIFVGARPGVGKSAFAITDIGIEVARSVDPRDGKRRGVFVSSMELERSELATRATARDAGIDLKRLVTRDVQDHEWSAVHAARARFETTLMRIDDAKAQTPRHVRARARQYAAQLAAMTPAAKLGLVVIDYLQLSNGLSLAGHDAKPNEQIDACAKFYADMASELDVPVLCCARMNRADKMKGTPRPTMDDFYGSSGVESHADEIWLLHRVGKDARFDLDIPKARTGGSLGRVFLQFDRGRFRGWSRTALAPTAQEELDI
jgi:replicative DNA helicase